MGGQSIKLTSITLQEFNKQLKQQQQVWEEEKNQQRKEIEVEWQKVVALKKQLDFGQVE